MNSFFNDAGMQAFRGSRLYGYIDAIYGIAATVMVVPTTTVTTITNSTTYSFAEQVGARKTRIIAVRLGKY